MRDLSTQELSHVYGAGGSSKACKPVKTKCKGKSGSRGKGSGSRKHGSGSRGRCGS